MKYLESIVGWQGEVAYDHAKARLIDMLTIQHGQNPDDGEFSVVVENGQRFLCWVKR